MPDKNCGWVKGITEPFVRAYHHYQCWEYSSPSPDSRPLFKDSDSYSDSYPWDSDSDSDSWNLRGLRLGLVIFVECLIVTSSLQSYYVSTKYKCDKQCIIFGRERFLTQIKMKIIEFGFTFWQLHSSSVLVSLVWSRLLRWCLWVKCAQDIAWLKNSWKVGYSLFKYSQVVEGDNKWREIIFADSGGR